MRWRPRRRTRRWAPRSFASSSRATRRSRGSRRVPSRPSRARPSASSSPPELASCTREGPRLGREERASAGGASNALDAGRGSSARGRQSMKERRLRAKVEAGRDAVAPLPAFRTRGERLATGRTLRDRVPRESHGDWKRPALRRDPIEVLDRSNAGRRAGSRADPHRADAPAARSHSCAARPR